MTPREMRSPSLRRQFARAMVFGVLVPALLLILGLVWFNLARERDGIDQRTRSVALSAARDVDEFIVAHAAAVNMLAQQRNDEGRAAATDRWPDDLARLRRNYPGFLSVLVTDAGGRVRFSDPSADTAAAGSRSVADRAYFSEPAATGRSYVSDVFRGRGLGTDPLVAVAAPLTGPDGFAGVVEGSIRTDTIAAARIRALHQRGYEVLLVDGAGRVIHASPGIDLAPLAPVQGTGFEPILAAAVPDAGAMRRLNRVLTTPGEEVGDAYAARADLDMGWRVLVLVPKRLLDAEVAARIVAPVAVVVFFVLGVLAASWQQMRSLHQGITRVVQTLRGFALGGTLPEGYARGLPRELQPVMDGVGDLSARLNVAYEGLQRSVQRQHELAESRREIVATREAEIEGRTRELRQAVDELDRISRTDALTGCLNYRGYEEALRALWRESVELDTPLSALAIDIDLFKDYNDRYGHPAGDNALRRFAGAARSALYGAADILARTGGEEFVVLLPGTALGNAVDVANRVRASVLHAGVIHEESPRGMMTVSVGVATRQADDPDPDSMTARADEALYHAKKAGRDRTSTGGQSR